MYLNEKLVVRLAKVGVNDNVLNFRNKVARSRFTAPFFVQYMVALGLTNLQVSHVDEIGTVTSDDHGAEALVKRSSVLRPDE